MATTVRSQVFSDVTGADDFLMTAQELAGQFYVSERTARRHIGYPTHARPRRQAVSRFRESYAHCRRPEREYSALHWDLERARNAVRRLARASAFTDGDWAEMRIIAGEANALLRHWTQARPSC
jgi:hypothetical protein